MAGARGGARVGRPKWARILEITGGSTMAAIMVKGAPQLGQVRVSKVIGFQIEYLFILGAKLSIPTNILHEIV